MTSAPITPQISQELNIPPPRPSVAAEPVPSDLDKLLKPDFTPAAPEPKPAQAETAPEIKPVVEKPTKSLKDEELDKFIAGTEAKEVKESPKEKSGGDLVEDREFKTPKALREAYELSKAEKSRLASELETFKKSQSDAKALLKEIEDLKKHNDEMEDTFRVHKYENSREYKEKFMAPMEKLYNHAISTLAELEVSDPDKGQRQATPQDLETLVRLPTGKAISHAKELFGDASSVVLSYRDQIKSLFQQTQDARESHKTRWAELEQKSKADSLAQQEQLESLWTKTNDDLTKKYSEVFAELEGDEEGNKLIASGRKLADLALRGSSELPMEQRVVVAAEIRNRAAAFSREFVRRKKAESEVSALKEKLKAFEGSSPDKGSTRPGKSKDSASPNSMEEALEALGALS
jgi:hypothetical protein